jgi:diguanylate cyclase (GGDEF)-like protein
MVGDMVLVTVAMLLGRSLRRSDVLTRYGGEEFSLVMPEAGGAAALVKLDKIRQGVAAAVLDLPDAREPNTLTISIGVATYPEDGATVELLMAVADERLLQAKRNGRDRVVGGEGLPSSS